MYVVLPKGSRHYILFFVIESTMRFKEDSIASWGMSHILFSRFSIMKIDVASTIILGKIPNFVDKGVFI